MNTLPKKIKMKILFSLMPLISYFYVRMGKVGLAISSPSEGKLEDLEAMDLQEKLSFLRQHRDWKCNVKQEVRLYRASSSIFLCT